MTRVSIRAGFMIKLTHKMYVSNIFEYTRNKRHISKLFIYLIFKFVYKE